MFKDDQSIEKKESRKISCVDEREIVVVSVRIRYLGRSLKEMWNEPCGYLEKRVPVERAAQAKI